MKPTNTKDQGAATKVQTDDVAISTVFLDIGGVLLTDGWTYEYRDLAAEAFDLDRNEFERRHHHAFSTHELGKISLEEYLDLVVFHQKRAFTPVEFREFMFAQSKPYPAMIALFRKLKAQYGLKIVVVSNEGRELNDHRIHRFKLDEFVDVFVSSCLVGIRKPESAIFRLALDLVQVSPAQVIYVENTPMFIEIAAGMGIRGIHHIDYASTSARLAAFGWKITADSIHENT